jgi:hypothetical protein
MFWKMTGRNTTISIHTIGFYKIVLEEVVEKLTSNMGKQKCLPILQILHTTHLLWLLEDPNKAVDTHRRMIRTIQSTTETMGLKFWSVGEQPQVTSALYYIFSTRSRGGYLGESQNVGNRIWTHFSEITSKRKTSHKYTLMREIGVSKLGVVCFPVQSMYRKEFEAILLSRFRPTWNRYIPEQKSTQLFPFFNRISTVVPQQMLQGKLLNKTCRPRYLRKRKMNEISHENVQSLVVYKNIKTGFQAFNFFGIIDETNYTPTLISKSAGFKDVTDAEKVNQIFPKSQIVLIEKEEMKKVSINIFAELLKNNEKEIPMAMFYCT